MTELLRLSPVDGYTYVVTVATRKNTFTKNTVKVTDTVLNSFSELEDLLAGFNDLKVLDLTNVKRIDPQVIVAIRAWKRDNPSIRILPTLLPIQEKQKFSIALYRGLR